MKAERAPDGRNGVGFSWRADGEPGRTELEDAAVCSPVSFSTSAFSRPSRSAPRAFCVSSVLPPRLPLAHAPYSLGKYVSIYMRARDRVIPCDRIVPMCARSISI